jgi:ketosteroid isomerase-like protein
VTADEAKTDDPGVELVRKMIDAFARRDADAVVALTAPNCVVVAQRSMIEGAFEGPEGARRWVEGYYEAIPDARVEVDRIEKTGHNEVVVLGRQLGTAPTAGTLFEAPLAAIAKHEDGMLVHLVLLPTHEEALAASGAAGE